MTFNNGFSPKRKSYSDALGQYIPTDDEGIRQIRQNYSHSNSFSCANKQSFNSQREAGEFNNRFTGRRSGSKRKEKLHVYKCLSCKQWHIGHPPRKGKLSRKSSSPQN